MKSLSSPKRALLLHSDEAKRAHIETILGSLGYSTDCNGSAKEALHAIDANQYEAVVWELLHPQLSGLRGSAELRMKENNTPVLLVSEQRHSVVDDFCRSNVFTACIVSPLDRESLSRVLGRLHRSRSENGPGETSTAVESASAIGTPNWDWRERTTPQQILVTWRCNATTLEWTQADPQESEPADPILGYLLGSPSTWLQRIHPADRETTWNALSDAATGGSAAELSYRFVTPEGTEIPVRHNVVALKEGNVPYELVGTLALFPSVAEEVRRLREREEHWRSLISSSTDFIATLDRDGRIRYINHTIPDYSVDEVIGTSMFDYVDESDRDRLAGYIESVFQAGLPVTYEVRSEGAGGKEAWYQCNVSRVDTKGDEPLALLISRDITNRKEAEAQLKATADDFESFLESFPYLVFRVDQTGCLLSLHGGDPTDLAYPRLKAQGRTLEELFPDRFGKRMADHVRAVISSGHAKTVRYALATPFPLGPVKEFEAQISPHKGDQAVAVVRTLERAL